MLLDQYKIKALREQRSWSQQRLADAAGLSIRTIQRLEKEGVASMESTLSLTAVFECELEEILASQQSEANYSKIAFYFYLAIALFIGLVIGLLI
jgi:DNA-binding XRE family transcriptional regulator